MMKMVMIMTVYDNEEIWIASSGLCVTSSWQCGGFNDVSLCVCVCVCVCVCERDWCSLCSLSHLCLGAAVAHRCVCVKEYGDPYSELVLCIYPSKVHTHSSEYTHTVNTHTHREHTPGAVGSHLCCGAWGAVGGSVPCSRALQSWYWRWRERCTFTPPTYNPCRTETRTHNLSITSLTH